ncbi:hypothetical protein [Nocardioides zeae]|uniref:Uncharacterized protein n=1 Tax=Nocardioides zeae TaxID=1457234 RepID=A0A6P0HH28_9ACTN|nr:hypothetical protein [Nocardioides zeae]NEN77891.1 hypothetical protein [Nocardioides zeae]
MNDADLTVSSPLTGALRWVRRRGRLLLVALVAIVLLGAAALRFDLVARLGGPSDLERALRLLPATVTSVVYADSAATAARLDLEVERGSYADHEEEYAAAVAGAPWLAPLGASDLVTWEDTMDGGAWSALDVRWSAVGRTGATSYAVLELDGDVDLDAVGDELVDHGYTEAEVAGRRSFEMTDYAALGDYPFLTRVTFLDGHVLGIGEAGPLTEVADGDADSLADAGRFDAVLPDEDAEAAVLRQDSDCAAAVGSAVVPADGGVAGLVRLAPPRDADVERAAADRRGLVAAQGQDGADVAERLDLADVTVEVDDDVVVVRFRAAGSRLLETLEDGTLAACSVDQALG